MTWYLLVFLSTTLGGLNEGFMWYDPTFENKQECIDWAKNNPAPIIQTLNYYYDEWAIDNLVCVREDRLKDFNMVPHPGNVTAS